MIKAFKECFSTNLNEYDKIGIDLEINKVVVGLAVAMIIGIIFFNTYRQNMKIMVSQLIRHGAKSEENAKTLSSLGLGKSVLIKRMLSRDNLLTKIVARKGEKRYGYEEYVGFSKEEKKALERVDFDTAEFYIREDKATLADGVAARYGASILNTVMSCVFVALMCACIIACMPGILNVINKIL